MFIKKAASLTVLFISCFTGGMVFGDILEVPTNYSTIQAAINAATAGDIVQVQPGLYSTARTAEVIPIDLKSGVNVVGPGAEYCIIDGANASSVFRAINDTDIIIDGLTIRRSSNGVWIDRDSEVHVQNCIIENGYNEGVAVWPRTTAGSQLPLSSVRNCKIRNCSGSAINAYTSLIIDSNLIENNGWDGIACDGYSASPIISNNTIRNNGFETFSGIWIRHGRPRIEKNIFYGNSHAIRIDGSAQPDLGGGAEGSLGLNIFQDDDGYAVVSNTDVPIAAKNNQWPTVDPDQSIWGNTLRQVIAQPVAEVLFKSDFSSLPVGDYFGPWSSSNALLHAEGKAPNAYSCCYFGDYGWKNYFVSFKVRERKGADFGFMFRSQSTGFAEAQTHPTYLLQKLGTQSDGDLRIFRYGSFEQLTPKHEWEYFARNQWHQFYVTISGSSFNVRYDDWKSFDGLDQHNLYSYGKIGFRVTDSNHWTWDFDDLAVYKLPDTVTSGVTDWVLY